MNLPPYVYTVDHVARIRSELTITVLEKKLTKLPLKKVNLRIEFLDMNRLICQTRRLSLLHSPHIFGSPSTIPERKPNPNRFRNPRFREWPCCPNIIAKSKTFKGNYLFLNISLENCFAGLLDADFMEEKTSFFSKKLRYF